MVTNLPHSTLSSILESSEINNLNFLLMIQLWSHNQPIFHPSPLNIRLPDHIWNTTSGFSLHTNAFNVTQRASHLQRKKNIPKLSLKYKAFEPCCGCNLLKYKIPSCFIKWPQLTGNWFSILVAYICAQSLQKWKTLNLCKKAPHSLPHSSGELSL